MLQRSLIAIAWIGILILSFTLRWQQIEERPIHADEATGARILAQRLAGDHYRFNPQHFHGPLLSLTSSPIAQIRSEETWSSLTVTTLRLGPIVAGMLLILTPLLWIRSIGAWGSVLAAALLGTSPLLVYYNRMYIHESLLTLFAMLSCAAVFRLALKPSKRMGVLTGLSLGLMFATKETFVISILAWLPAVVLCIWSQQSFATKEQNISKIRDYLIPALLLAVTTTTIAAYFYSDGFRSPQGMIDALRTYFVYETTAGHEKNFSYYFQLLLWPKHQLGMWWSEALILLLATGAVLLAGYKRNPNRAILFLTVATLGHFIIYSCIGYKTPWLMLVPWAHACLLAGCVIKTLPHLRIRPRILLGLLFLGGLSYQTQQSIQASGRLANDNRNPYAYVPTSKDAPKIERWLQQLNNLSEVPPLTPIAVVGQEYWPLPWYLRRFDTIGYWPAPIEDFTHFSIVFAMPAHVLACDQLLSTTHVKLPRSLRTNVPVTLYLRKDIWQDWMNTTEE
ncbi:flippase activity-associated protein Agl23 [Coraliomargarita sp. W4R72]